MVLSENFTQCCLLVLSENFTLLELALLLQYMIVKKSGFSAFRLIGVLNIPHIFVMGPPVDHVFSATLL